MTRPCPNATGREHGGFQALYQRCALLPCAPNVFQAQPVLSLPCPHKRLERAPNPTHPHFSCPCPAWFISSKSSARVVPLSTVCLLSRPAVCLPFAALPAASLLFRHAGLFFLQSHLIVQDKDKTRQRRGIRPLSPAPRGNLAEGRADGRDPTRGCSSRCLTLLAPSPPARAQTQTQTFSPLLASRRRTKKSS